MNGRPPVFNTAVGTRDGIGRMKRELRLRVSQDWNRHRDHQRFLQDHFPAVWEDVQLCETTYKFEDEEWPRPDTVRVTALECRKVPWCIRCTDRATSRKASDELNAIRAITPKDKVPQFLHLVQTAPIYDDRTGWGQRASRDIGAFFDAQWATLQDLFGEGIALTASYQDFGERGPKKRIAHLDCTLGAWSLSPAGPKRLQRPDLTNGGYVRWQDTLVQHSASLRPDGHHGNGWIARRFMEPREYMARIRYQVRSMWDFRKLTYDRPTATLTWRSYEGPRTPYTIDELLYAFDEYQKRLKPFGKHQASNLHRRFGLIAKKTIGKAQRAMGGEDPAHRPNCWCGQCHEWRRFFLDGESPAPTWADP